MLLLQLLPMNYQGDVGTLDTSLLPPVNVQSPAHTRYLQKDVHSWIVFKKVNLSRTQKKQVIHDVKMYLF